VDRALVAEDTRAAIGDALVRDRAVDGFDDLEQLMSFGSRAKETPPRAPREVWTTPATES
jgi:hypothetical protein